jgi:hypothetical protein
MADNPIDDAENKIKINYVKTCDFREVACDGVLGGPTPQGKIWLSFYTERFPIPKVVEHSLVRGEGEGEFSIGGNPVVIESREGVIRNMEFGVYMSLAAAEQLRDWLIQQLPRKIGESK